MSFLGDLVGSIGTGKPLPQSSKPKPADIARTNSPVSKAVPKPGVPASGPGDKRKVDDNAPSSSNKIIRPQPPTPGSALIRKPAPPLNAPRPQSDRLPLNKLPTDRSVKDSGVKPSTSDTASSAKPPPSKGSFAELMARAQARAPQQNVGIIKHTKTAPKEKLSKREQERRNQELKARAAKSGNGGVRKPDNRRSTSPAKSGVQNGRVAKPEPARPVYRGTLGMSAKRDKPRSEKQSRYDEYLGTDEEDNSDIEDDEGDGYESSDMEGGFDDLEMEESAALRAAKVDDAREMALENQLKREKDERRRRLEALSKKRK